MPTTPARRANPADAADIATYRAAYARDGKRVVLRPGADRASAHQALSRLVKRYLPLARSIRDLHTPTLDDHTAESALWDALGGVKSFSYVPDRAPLAAWLRTVAKNILVSESRLLSARAHDEIDESTPAEAHEDDIFLIDLFVAIDAILATEPRRDAIREAARRRVVEPAIRGHRAPTRAEIADALGLSEDVTRTVTDRAEEVVREAAQNLHLAARI